MPSNPFFFTVIQILSIMPAQLTDLYNYNSLHSYSLLTKLTNE